MFKIGEFSKLTQVSVRMLRYYDEAGLLKPAVIDKYTGYRLYSTEQIPVLQRIVLLRDMEFNVAEIGAALDSWEEDSIKPVLKAKRDRLLEDVSRLRLRIGKIDAAIEDIGTDQIQVHCNITLRSVPAFQILSLRETIPDHFCEHMLWERLCGFVEKNRIEIQPGVNNLAIFHDEGDGENGVDTEVGVLVKRPGLSGEGFVYRRTEAVECMACIMVYGPYENIGPAFHSFAYWLEEHRQYEMCGPTRQICHIGVGDETDEKNFLTEIQVPVRRKGIDSDTV